MDNKVDLCCRKNRVGGQAVIEGVMMKNGSTVALAVRKEDGTIEIDKSEFIAVKTKHKWINIPILRGIVGFFESLILSFKTLSKATDMLGLDELEEQERQEKEAKKEAKKRAKLEKKGLLPKEDPTENEKTPEDVAENEEKTDTPTVKCNEDSCEIVFPTKKEENTTHTEECDGDSCPISFPKEVGKDEIEEKKTEKKKSDGGATVFVMAISLVLGLGLALLLFSVLPSLISKFISDIFDFDNRYIFATIEGIVKVLIFIGYLAGVSLMKDIKRTFQYHGAEHKSIACFESGMDLTPENARKCTRFHPRCGTSFMFVMILLGIIVGMFIPEFKDMVWLRILIKIATLPIVMGVGYEFIMFAGKHENWLTKALSAPGLWMQRITTKEPDDNQLAIAICAIKSSMPDEFPDFDPSEYYITREENKGHICNID